MAIQLTKKACSSTGVEEIYPQRGAVPQILEQVPEMGNAPNNPPAVVQPASAAKTKKAVVDRTVGSKIRQQEENIPLADLTALDREQLCALTEQSVKEIEEAFALIQRVGAEGERRAELDDFWSDDYFSHVCEFHRGIFQKMSDYNKRHRKMHPIIYRKEHDYDFCAILATSGTLLFAAIGVALHFLGLY